MEEETANSIPRGDIESIEIHPVYDFYLVVLKEYKKVWYAKEFTATATELRGEFHTDRF